MVDVVTLKQIQGAEKLYPIIGDDLEGARLSVLTPDKREIFHIVTDGANFPWLKIGVQGSDTIPVERSVFAMADDVDFELRTEELESSVRKTVVLYLSDQSITPIHRPAYSSRKETVYSENGIKEAEVRLVIIFRERPVLNDHEALVSDLWIIRERIIRDSDLSYIKSLSGGRMTKNGRLTPRQEEWIYDIVERVSGLITADWSNNSVP